MPGRAPRRGLVYALVFMASTAATLAAQTGDPPRIFISVDMEGISGVGTPAMTSSGGKDYATGRRLATDEVNAVVAAILARGPAEIVVNDSHGDHQNLLHTDLDPRVTYIQGSVKPLGMVEGLDSSFDAAIFIWLSRARGVRRRLPRAHRVRCGQGPLAERHRSR